MNKYRYAAWARADHSAAQQTRQRRRTASGQYEHYLECYAPGCTKRLGDDYYSDRRTDRTDANGVHWGDLALGLCQRCYKALDKLDDTAAYAAMTSECVPWIRQRRYVVVKAADYGMDPAGGPWVCFCKTHTTLCNFETRREAQAHRPLGDWCESCMAESQE